MIDIPEELKESFIKVRKVADMLDDQPTDEEILELLKLCQIGVPVWENGKCYIIPYELAEKIRLQQND